MLFRQIQKLNGRIPFKLTFNLVDKQDSNADAISCDFENDRFIDKYRNFSKGILTSIGVDGSVFIHSQFIAQKYKQDQHLFDNDQQTSTNDEDIVIVSDMNRDCYMIDKPKNAQKIASVIHNYVMAVCIFFDLFNKSNSKSISNNSVILHVVFDGSSPMSKKRRKADDVVLDPYSLMTINDKIDLQKRIINTLRAMVTDFNKDVKNVYKLKLLSNVNCPYADRKEGELVLFELCQQINERRQQRQTGSEFNKSIMKHVLISSDSDLMAILILRRDYSVILINPPTSSPDSQIYITDLALVCDGLMLKIEQAIKYVILHFILFGSDYNVGLMSYPNETKQSVIYNAITSNQSDINSICQNCSRKKIKSSHETPQPIILKRLKDRLIPEAINAIMYYASLGNGKYIVKNKKQALFLNSKEVGRYIPLLKFNN